LVILIQFGATPSARLGAFFYLEANLEKRYSKEYESATRPIICVIDANANSELCAFGGGYYV